MIPCMQGRAQRIQVRELRRLREGAGLKQGELANLVGLSVSMVSQMESGKKGASHATLLRLAKAIGCTVEQLTGKKSDDPHELTSFLEGLAPENLQEEEIESLRLARVPGYRLTARAYNYLLDVIRNSERMHS